MRRLGSLVEREPEGTWIITPNHLERAADFERTRARAAPMIVETLSALPLDKQVAADGATWLERELVRSEEHTSELQSLMRISYAVFCLNTNKQQQAKTDETHQ